MVDHVCVERGGELCVLLIVTDLGQTSEGTAVEDLEAVSCRKGEKESICFVSICVKKHWKGN